MAVKVLGAIGTVDSAEDLLNRAHSFEDQHSATVQILRADRIFGRIHLFSAVEHAQRAFEQGRNRSNNLCTEILLYCAAERQIKNAIRLLGITDETRKMALVVVGEASEKKLLAYLGLEQDDGVLEGEKDFEAFGITDEELKAVAANRLVDLILEKMALSELDR